MCLSVYLSISVYTYMCVSHVCTYTIFIYPPGIVESKGVLGVSYKGGWATVRGLWSDFSTNSTNYTGLNLYCHIYSIDCHIYSIYGYIYSVYSLRMSSAFCVSIASPDARVGCLSDMPLTSACHGHVMALGLISAFCVPALVSSFRVSSLPRVPIREMQRERGREREIIRKQCPMKGMRERALFGNDVHDGGVQVSAR